MRPFRNAISAGCLAAVLSLYGGTLQGQTPAATPAQTPPEHLAALKLSSSLHHEGLRPWHLRMSFQLFTLTGKPQETGTVEEWWVAPGRHRVVIDSPSYHSTTPSTTSESSGDDRAGYLIDLLLRQVTDPIPAYRESDHMVIREAPRKFGGVKLSCITVAPEKYPDWKTTSFCVEPGKPALRVALDTADEVLTRNKLVGFQNTNLALDNSISFSTGMAISGHIESLEGFDPVKNPVDLTEKAEPERIPGVALAGVTVRKVTPTYPPQARQQHISGSVLLDILIGKDGRVGTVDVIASPSPLLSEASIASVKQWQYSPYLIDGTPTEVRASVTMNFNFGN